MICPWADCWCRAWPPMRQVVSTGRRYTAQRINRGWYRRSDGRRVTYQTFVYHYTEAA